MSKTVKDREERRAWQERRKDRERAQDFIAAACAAAAGDVSADVIGAFIKTFDCSAWRLSEEKRA